MFFLPFLLYPTILTQKDNDLGRYLPIFNFVKNSVIDYKILPLWRSEQMMGETLIGNALFPIAYPLNVILLIFPIDLASVIYYLAHFLIAAFSTYFLARSFSFNKYSSMGTAIFYIFSTKMLLHLSAGHITMVAAFAYFPLSFLTIRKVLENQEFKWVIVGSLSNAFILILYPTIFYYSTLFLFFYVLYKLPIFKKGKKILVFKKLTLVTLMFAVTFGLSALQLLPELEFGPFSTRSMLMLRDVALPLWNLEKFLKSLIFPFIDLDIFDHEALLYLGFVPTLLATLSFFYLPRLKKLILGFFGVLTLMFVAGLSTPVFELAYDFLPYLKYSRVTTRLWFVVALIVALLAGNTLNKIKSKPLIYLLVGIFIIESFYIGYKKILNVSDLDFKNQEIYQFLAKDKDLFRVYCTTYCFNPQLVQKHNLQILHGETPIQDKKFVDFLQEAGNYSYEKFAVIFPPYQAWQVETPPVPNAALLGLANVKYVASTYKLENNNFMTVGKFDNVYLYQNRLYKSRVFFKNSEENITIEKYSPNRIIVKFKKSDVSREMVFSEKYYPGWFVYMNNKKYKAELEEPIFRKIVVLPDTDRLEMVYAPESFKTGRMITLGTICFLIIYFLKNNKIWRK